MEIGTTCALPFIANKESPALAFPNPGLLILVPSGNIPNTYPSFIAFKMLFIVDISGFSLFIGITFNFFKIYPKGFILKSSFFAIAATCLFSIAAAINIGSRLDL